jgi:hypothetical protein
MLCSRRESRLMLSKEDFAVGAKDLREEVAGLYDKLHNYEVHSC